jgi:fatty acid desaturase
VSIKTHLKHNYKTYIMATNAMIAVATAAFAVLGIFSGSLTTPVLVGNAAVFGVIWAVGKFGNEQLEDMEHEDHCHA